MSQCYGEDVIRSGFGKRLDCGDDRRAGRGHVVYHYIGMAGMEP